MRPSLFILRGGEGSVRSWGRMVCIVRKSTGHRLTTTRLGLRSMIGGQLVVAIASASGILQ